MLKTFTAFMEKVDFCNRMVKSYEDEASLYRPFSYTWEKTMAKANEFRKEVDKLCEDHPIFATMYNLNKKRGRAV